MKKVYGIVVLLTVLVSSCGPTVDTVKVSDTNLSSYQTFAYLPNSNFDDKSIGYKDETVGREVISNVNRNLEKAGFTLDRENPDILVLISTKTDVDTETVREPVYAGYPNGVRVAGARAAVSPYYDPFYYTYYNSYNSVVGYDTDTYKIKEGTLMVDLVDRETKKVIWRGTASDEIYQADNSEAISSYVDDIFNELPKIDRKETGVADF